MSPVADMKRRARRLALKMGLLYLAIMATWIVGSDWLALQFSTSQEQLALIQSIKGVLFVFVMAAAISTLTYHLFIAHQRKIRAEILSTTDIITQLRNQRALMEELSRCMESRNKPFGLVFFDALNFARVNASLGRDRGDLVLFRMGRRIQRAAGQGAIIARFEADKFALITPAQDSSEDIASIARRVVDELNREYSAGDHAIKLDVFGGYTVIDPVTRPEITGLVSATDTALEQAKQARITRLVQFDPSLEEDQGAQFTIEMELRSALQKGELDVHFQPQVRLSDGSVRGAEVLVRWPHPDKGMISPGTFIPVAEQSGLIDQIGAFVIERATEKLAELRKSGYQDLVISINAAGHQLDSGELPSLLAAAAERWKLPLDRVELEVTETMALKNPEESIRYLQELRESGVRVALDDFGTGYSSLQYLLDLPVDVLKIDQSFIAGLPDDQRQARFVRTIVDLARDLDLKIVAEGVETQGQRDLLAGMGCHVAQGFLLARPMAAGAFRQWLEGRPKKS